MWTGTEVELLLIITLKYKAYQASGPQCGGRADAHLSGHMEKVQTER